VIFWNLPRSWPRGREPGTTTTGRFLIAGIAKKPLEKRRHHGKALQEISDFAESIAGYGENPAIPAIDRG